MAIERLRLQQDMLAYDDFVTAEGAKRDAISRARANNDYDIETYLVNEYEWLVAANPTAYREVQRQRELAEVANQGPIEVNII